MDYERVDFKSLTFIDIRKDNKKYFIEGKPKMIEIVSYGVHSTNAGSKKFVYIDLGNFLPGMNYLYCHVMDDNHFITPAGFKFNNNNVFNGSFNPKVYDIATSEEITDYLLVINLNLYY